VSTSGAKPYAITVAATATTVAIPVGSVMPPATAAARALPAPTNATTDPIRSHRATRPTLAALAHVCVTLLT
jgi:hypothetical protein